MRRSSRSLLFPLLSLAATGALAGCDVPTPRTVEQPGGEILEDPGTPAIYATDAFKTYWYAGEAELTSYQLTQARYGALHEGTAVLIYVTEDFSKSKQVKLDDPTSAGDDRVKVLKLNLTKNFTTGIYPYSMMTSVFSPVRTPETPRALKVTTSSQEWCGHTFTQLNRTPTGYHVSLLSYFESEGDTTADLETAWLEDEVWTRIRLTPDGLPEGDVKMVPGAMYQRLSHVPPGVADVVASLDRSQGSAWTYSLHYPALDRTLVIRFESGFPHAILGWEERYRAGRGPHAEMLTTRAQRRETLMLDYWTRNQPDDLPLRGQLGLKP